MRSKRSTVHYLVILACLFLANACAVKQAPEPVKHPNILVVVVDDLGQMDIEPNNPGTFYRTPHLSRFAQQSIRFDNHYAASPVCSPSRYALMTGKHPADAAVTDWFHKSNTPPRSERFEPASMNGFMATEEVTIAEQLKSVGYATAFVGKWHLGEQASYWPENQGFDTNIGGYWSGSPRGTNGYFAPHKNPRLQDGPDGEYLTERLTTETISLLQDMRQQATPFFIFLSYYTVHRPLGAPALTVQQYEERINQQGLVTTFGTEEQAWPDAKGPRRVRTSQDHPVYAAMVEQMDLNFGRLLKALDELGLANDTLVIFTSDNGGLSTSEGLPTSNLPFRGGKGWVYEGGIRVPLIIRWPGKHASGRVNTSPVSGLDIYPTILDSAGLQLDAMEGQSLLTTLKTGQKIENRPLFWHYPHYSNQGGVPASAVRLGDYKFIRRLEDGGGQLFNLAMDPGELNNLVNSETEKAEEMASLLDARYRQKNARFLNPKAGVAPWRPSVKLN